MSDASQRSLSDSGRQQILALLRQDRKLEAIAIYREETGVSLAAATKAVEVIHQAARSSAAHRMSSNLEQQVLKLLRQGHKSEAIKLIKERMHTGLNEAKDAIEALAAKQGGQTKTRRGCLPVLLVALLSFVGLVRWARAAAADAQIAPAIKDPQGFLVHTVESEYQAGPTHIRVLLPDRLEPGRRYPVIYVLPVEARDEHRYGHGLQEIGRQDLHNVQQAIFVAPTFSHLPWYADHPTDSRLRQETYFLNVVVPFVELRYPAQNEPAGRLLLGFSKSGYGAFSLLLRHPDVFGRAAAWDAPVNMARPDRFGMAEIYGTPENFEHYRIPQLLEQRAELLRAGGPAGSDARLASPGRLILLGYGNFREHHRQVAAQLSRLQIPYHNEDGPQRAHQWSSGWVAPAVALLLGKSSS